MHSFLLGKYVEVEMLFHGMGVCLIAWQTAQLIFKLFYHFIFLSTIYESTVCSKFLPAFIGFALFILAILVCV
jgi:hypothetical protein